VRKAKVLTLSDVRFTGNHADQNTSLAGMDVEEIQSSATIDAGVTGASVDGLDIEANTTTNGVTPLGLTGSFSQLDKVTIAGNSSAGRQGGGATLNLTRTATATNWTVAGNQLTASGGSIPVAGGIDVTGGTPRLNDATNADNSAGGNADDLRTAARGRSRSSIRSWPVRRLPGLCRVPLTGGRSRAAATTSISAARARSTRRATSATPIRSSGH